MREILFRGKIVDSGEWTHGMLCKGLVSEYAIEPVDEFGRRWAIYTDTIGQYTGLQDKNGVKIFEGDIIKIIDLKDVPHWMHDENSVVEYDKDYAGFKPYCEYDSDCGEFVRANNTIVIGNIHDNPELLE